MKFVSTEGKAPERTFQDVLLEGLAPDGGLYVPARLPALPRDFTGALATSSLHDVGVEVLSAFINDIPRAALSEILQRAWTFPIPLVRLEDDLFLLELFHGPTLAFKDVGARCMAHMLSYYLRTQERHLSILVATSGDTGGAVAHGFAGVPRITVQILYPSGRISTLQEKQINGPGGNIHALAIDGTFDDCQRLVKQALADDDLVRMREYTTANSINLGRLLPQIAFHAWGIAQYLRLPPAGSPAPPPAIVVPSGNFGNLTACLYAREMGIPMGKVVAATNSNDAGAEFLRTGTLLPKRAIPTPSSAMDVGNPSNVARLEALFRSPAGRTGTRPEAFSIAEEQTVGEIRRTFERSGVVVDPHTAVGLAAARRLGRTQPVIVAATAHPAKFPDVIERATGVPVPLPEPLAIALRSAGTSVALPSDYASFKEYLLGQE